MRTYRHGVRQQKGKPQRVRAARRSMEREAGAPSLGTRNTRKEEMTRKPPVALRVLSFGGGEDLKAAS